jgi:hypothetical protein
MTDRFEHKEARRLDATLNEDGVAQRQSTAPEKPHKTSECPGDSPSPDAATLTGSHGEGSNGRGPTRRGGGGVETRVRVPPSSNPLTYGAA